MSEPIEKLRELMSKMRKQAVMEANEGFGPSASYVRTLESLLPALEQRERELREATEAEIRENASRMLSDADQGIQTAIVAQDGKTVLAVMGLNGTRYLPDPDPDPLDEVLRQVLEPSERVRRGAQQTSPPRDLTFYVYRQNGESDAHYQAKLDDVKRIVLAAHARELLQARLTQEKERDEWRHLITTVISAAKGWFHEHDMYRGAWLREMGGEIRRKTHEIDGFVLRTRDIYEGYKQVPELKKHIAELERQLAELDNVKQ